MITIISNTPPRSVIWVWYSTSYLVRLFLFLTICGLLMCTFLCGLCVRPHPIHTTDHVYVRYLYGSFSLTVEQVLPYIMLYQALWIVQAWLFHVLEDFTAFHIFASFCTFSVINLLFYAYEKKPFLPDFIWKETSGNFFTHDLLPFEVSSQHF